jgi:hypothetical protein
VAHVRADVSDLVKKAGATVSFLKYALFIGHGTRKSAAHMAKQFAFEQRLCERKKSLGYIGYTIFIKKRSAG